MPETPQHYDIFISYSRLDSKVADQICEALNRAGLTYFIDRKGIGGGMEFPSVLANAIVNSDIFLYLGSANSYKSKFTNAEITFAFNKKERNRIVPYLIDGTSLPIELEFTFSAINWRVMANHPVAQLVEDLVRLLGKKQVHSESNHNANPKSSTPPAPERPSLAPELKELLQKANDCKKLRDEKGAFEYFLKAARIGDPEAQFQVGRCYELGLGVNLQPLLAEEWYEKSAIQVYGKGMAAYGRLLFKKVERREHFTSPLGHKKHIELTWYYLKAAAQKGFASAQLNLGRAYLNFDMGDKNPKNAAQWFIKAAENGEMEAYRQLAELYLHGIGVPQDAEAGERYLKIAAEAGNMFARSDLGCYYKEIGRTADAKRWLEIPAQKNILTAAYNLAVIYKKEKNYSRAYKYFLKAEKLSQHVKWEIAQLKEFGFGTFQDLPEALAIYESLLTKNDFWVATHTDQIKKKVGQLKRVLLAKKIGLNLSHGEYEG